MPGTGPTSWEIRKRKEKSQRYFGQAITVPEVESLNAYQTVMVLFGKETHQRWGGNREKVKG